MWLFLSKTVEFTKKLVLTPTFVTPTVKST